uniref:Uncharacterized protein n=1 Tax=Steinernema glaseri TaxID=37863 RepID=A0A1I7ZSP9_9BILA
MRSAQCADFPKGIKEEARGGPATLSIDSLTAATLGVFCRRRRTPFPALPAPLDEHDGGGGDAGDSSWKPRDSCGFVGQIRGGFYRPTAIPLYKASSEGNIAKKPLSKRRSSPCGVEGPPKPLDSSSSHGYRLHIPFVVKWEDTSKAGTQSHDGQRGILIEKCMELRVPEYHESRSWLVS